MGTTCEGLEGFEVGRCGEVERCGGWDAWFNSGHGMDDATGEGEGGESIASHIHTIAHLGSSVPRLRRHGRDVTCMSYTHGSTYIGSRYQFTLYLRYSVVVG